MSRRYDKLFEVGFLIGLFCFAIALLNLSGYIFSAIVLLMLFLSGPKIRLSSTDLWLFLFSICYFFFYWLHFDITINSFIVYFVGPWSAYILGKFYIEHSTNKNSFMILIIVLSLGMYLHGILNILAYVRSDYFSMYKYYRQSVDFWRGELVNVKTTEMLYTFVTGISLGVLFTSYKKKYKILATIAILISILLTVFMANRALLVIFIVVLMWRFCCWLADAHVTSNKKIIIILGCLIFFLGVVTMIVLNIAGIGDYFTSLKIVQRFTSENELTRWDVWSLFFKDFNFMSHPFGGKLLTQNSDFGYLHNMWLDVYNVVGVVPFLILIVLSVKFIFSIHRFNKVVKIENKKNEGIVFQSLMLAVLLNMMIEPIIEANPYYFLMVLMLLGAMEEYMHKVMIREGHVMKNFDGQKILYTNSGMM